jgi:hypothetical protein
VAVTRMMILRLDERLADEHGKRRENLNQSEARAGAAVVSPPRHIGQR